MCCRRLYLSLAVKPAVSDLLTLEAHENHLKVNITEPALVACSFPGVSETCSSDLALNAGLQDKLLLSD